MSRKSDKEFLIRVRADVQQALADLKKLPGVIKDSGEAGKKATQNIGGMERGLQSLTRAALAYVSVRSAIYIIKQADAFNVLNTRIKTATRDSGDYVEVQKALYNITQKNGVEFSTTVALFQNLARSASELEATNAQMLTLTNTVEQLGVISGTSAANQRAGLLQFSQGLSAGIFRAEEFNSLLENMPELANRIAKGMGQTPGELRRAIIEGKVLSKDVFDALIKQSEEINQQFQEIPISVERASTRISTAFDRMLSGLDGATGATKFIAKAMNNAADNFDYIAIRLSNDKLAKLNQDLKITEQLLEHQKKAGFGDGGAAQTYAKTVERIKNDIKEIKRIMDSGDINSANFIGPKQTQSLDKKLERITVNKDQESIDKLISSLERERDLFGQTKEAAALYKLELMGASPAEIKLAEAIVATTAAKQAHDEAMKEGARIYAETRTEQENFSTTLAHLNDLYAKGAFGAVGSAEAIDTLARAVFDADEKFTDLGEKGEETFAGLTAATRGWGDQFTNTLADMVQQGKLDFSSLADSIISDLLRIMIMQQITGPLFGSIGIPGFESFVNHSGGMAGTGPKRTVNPFVFAGAQRFHSGGFPGLAADEVPAILQKGELVLSKDQVAGAAGGGGGGTLRVEIENKGQPAKVSQAGSSTDINGQVISIVLDDINRGGKIRGAIKTVSNQ